MDKRYQVFVSSTFRDLTEERREVMHALLEMDAFPAGMELFPAADEDAWALIQRVIEQSDYYVLIIGGKYGSTDEEGISYTEREYDYAVQCQIPVLPFLHQNPDEIPGGKLELDKEARERLTAFRSKVEDAHHCKYWNDPEQLGSRVSRAMMQAVRQHDRTGWVRADEAGGPEALAELNRLRRQIDELNDELRRSRVEPPKGTDELLHGDDEVPIECSFYAYSDDALEQGKVEGFDFISRNTFKGLLGMSWDEVYSTVAPLMLHEAREAILKSTIEEMAHTLRSERDDWYIKHNGASLSLTDDAFQAIKVQLIALGLIEKPDRKRAVSDTATYWTLTPYGDTYLMTLRAMRRDDYAEGAPTITDKAESDASEHEEDTNGAD